MSLSSPKDKLIAKKESDHKRNTKKNCTPSDNYGERYVTGTEKLRTQGKGDSYRVIEGWYSAEMTERFNQIFKKMDNKVKEKDEKETK